MGRKSFYDRDVYDREISALHRELNSRKTIEVEFLCEFADLDPAPAMLWVYLHYSDYVGAFMDMHDLMSDDLYDLFDDIKDHYQSLRDGYADAEAEFKRGECSAEELADYRVSLYGPYCPADICPKV